VAIVATGFAAGERPDHWKRHGYEFPELVDEFEYEQLAMAFLNERLDPTKVHECVRRRDGDTIRYEPGTENFAVIRADGVIRTFFRPRVGWHKLSSNLVYFQRECSQ
jgi:pyocin large subunit-like protein